MPRYKSEKKAQETLEKNIEVATQLHIENQSQMLIIVQLVNTIQAADEAPIQRHYEK